MDNCNHDDGDLSIIILVIIITITNLEEGGQNVWNIVEGDHQWLSTAVNSFFMKIIDIWIKI